MVAVVAPLARRRRLLITRCPPWFAACPIAACGVYGSSQVKFPNYLSPDCVSFLKGLLERNVERRLGATKSTMFKIGGVRAIKNHRWFKVCVCLCVCVSVVRVGGLAISA